MRNIEERDEQFENIKRIKSEYIEKGTDPIISMNVKKKEQLGNFYREGTLYNRSNKGVRP